MIALIENGDEIEMDIAGGTVNLLVSDEILAERRKSWVRPPLKSSKKGVLNIYAQNCRPAEEGGAMQPWALDADYGYHQNKKYWSWIRRNGYVIAFKRGY